MNLTEWPLVDANDDGIRPAGEPDACFYCDQKVGRPHGPMCVMVKKRVEMRFRLRLEDGREATGLWQLNVPYFWNARENEFHKNESCWCADNLRQHLADVVVESGSEAWLELQRRWAAANERECVACPLIRFEFSRVVDATPRRVLRAASQIA